MPRGEVERARALRARAADLCGREEDSRIARAREPSQDRRLDLHRQRDALREHLLLGGAADRAAHEHQINLRRCNTRQALAHSETSRKVPMKGGPDLVPFTTSLPMSESCKVGGISAK
eukprot:2404013-Pleurochrysis_carterae.AAC.3